MVAIAAPLNAALRRLPVWPFYILGLVPMAWMFWQALQNNLGADPVKALEHFYGLTALQVLIATLAVTPLLRLTRINLMRFRRMLGLTAFAYASVHFSIWAVLDLGLEFGAIVDDVRERPFVTAGFSAFVLLIPLAVTSTRRWMRRLGRRWVWLLRSVYVAAVLAVVHYLWLVKADLREPLVYAAILGMLLAARLPGLRRFRLAREGRHRAPGA
jgi:sulfoxide reductase heme-binding subunit YedZ